MKSCALTLRLGLLGILSVSVCWLGGCGPAGAPTGSVQGKVTHNGAPLTTGTVTFVNQGTGVGASAELDGTGNYRVESILTGDYQVAIQPPAAPNPEEVAAGAKVQTLTIPDKFQSPQTSDLTAKVEVGSNTVDFELK